MKRRLSRKSGFALVLTLVVLAGIGATVTVLMLRPEQITARAALNNACADMDNYVSFNAASITIEKGGRISSRAVMEMDVEHGMRQRLYHISNDGEELALERRVIFSTSTPLPTDATGQRSTGDRASSGRAVEPAEKLYLYYDFYTESPGNQSGWSQTHYAYTESELDAIEVPIDDEFCGVPIEGLVGIRRVGPAAVNGISAIHYSGNVEGDGDPNTIGEDDEKWDFWVDLEGRPIRYKVQNRLHGYATQTTYSNWDERVVIAAPVTPDVSGTTPTPTVAPTPSPTLTPTPSPTPLPGDGCTRSLSGNGPVAGEWTSDCD